MPASDGTPATTAGRIPVCLRSPSGLSEPRHGCGELDTPYNHNDFRCACLAFRFVEPCDGCGELGHTLQPQRFRRASSAFRSVGAVPRMWRAGHTLQPQRFRCACARLPVCQWCHGCGELDTPYKYFLGGATIHSIVLLAASQATAPTTATLSSRSRK